MKEPVIKNQYQYRKLKSSVRWAAAVSRVRSKPRLLGHGFFHQFTLDETGLKYILSLQFFISNLPWLYIQLWNVQIE